MYSVEKTVRRARVDVDFLLINQLIFKRVYWFTAPDLKEERHIGAVGQTGSVESLVDVAEERVESSFRKWCVHHQERPACSFLNHIRATDDVIAVNVITDEHGAVNSGRN